MRSVRSVMDQTRPPAQVVLINDGSTDKSIERLEEFLKDRPDKDKVTLIHMEKNLGVYVARNKGLDAATQSYLAFQDADDFWHPKKLEIQMEILENNPDVYFLCHKVDVWPTDKPIVWPERVLNLEKLVPINAHVALWLTRLHTISVVMKNTPKYRFDESMWRGGAFGQSMEGGAGQSIHNPRAGPQRDYLMALRHSGEPVVLSQTYPPLSGCRMP